MTRELKEGVAYSDGKSGMAFLVKKVLDTTRACTIVEGCLFRKANRIIYGEGTFRLDVQLFRDWKEYKGKIPLRILDQAS